MIEYGYAQGFSIDRSIIIAPIGAFAPSGVIAIAGTVNNVTVADLSFKAHGFCKSNRHGPFLGVAERDRLVGCLDSDVEVEASLVICSRDENPQCPFVSAYQRPVGSDPIIFFFDNPKCFAGGNFGKAVMDNSANTLLLRPKVMAINGAVGEPKGTMVGMIVFLIRGILHWPIPGHRQPSRADKGVTKGAGHVFKEILCEERAINLHPQAVILF